MLIAGFPAEVFGTNCYVVATGAGRAVRGRRPGHRRARPARRGARRAPAAARPRSCSPTVTSTTRSRSRRCAARAGITAYVHPADREMLADPAKALSMDLTELFGGRLTYTEPDDVAELTDGGHDHRWPAWRSPSTTRPAIPAGRCCSGCPAAGSPCEADEVCLSGDVLFAGSIGRTDLPGGSMADDAAPACATRSCRSPTTPSSCPATARRPRSAGSARTNPYLREVDRPRPARGL